MSAKILIVDDEPDLELLVVQKFRHRTRAGEFVFLFAHDGEEALEKLESDPQIAVVVTDIRMPRMDGLTLLGRLRDMSRLLRTIVVSAYSDMDNIRTAMNRGAFDFVTKPINFKDLETTIDKTIEDIESILEVDQKRRLAERTQSILAHYVSPNLAEHLTRNPGANEFGGERRELSFVFTDMANYTSFIENSDPVVAVSVMNEYINGMCDIVLANKGTIDNVVGDAVIAMFGAPVAQSDHAVRAVCCALQLDAFSSEFAAGMNADGVEIGTTRIGVHTGTALVGNFGGDAYFHYTAQGDTIVTAARLEGANKHLGTRICVSGDTVKMIPGFAGRPVGKLILKGKVKEIEVFEPLLNHNSEDSQAYLHAYSLLDNDVTAAIREFAALVGDSGEDALAKFHLQRLLSGEHGTVIRLREK